MAQIYVVTSALTAGAAAASIKVAVGLATGAQVSCKIVQIDVTFNGTNAAAKPVLVELVRCTGASSTGGTAPTPARWTARANAQTTARINDTTDGASPAILAAYQVPPTSGLVLQYPLGREFEMTVSDFFEVRITWATAETVVSYLVNVFFEE